MTVETSAFSATLAVPPEVNTGALSFTSVTLIVAVAVAVPPRPSLTVTVSTWLVALS